ncbi:DoxX family protein [Streptomyces stramineus]
MRSYTAPLLAPASAASSSQHGYDVGLLLLRCMVGLTMAAHGAQKLFGWFGGQGLDATGHGFAESGYSAPKAMAVVAGLTEVVGGAGLFLGLLTPLSAAAVVGIMINAMAVKAGGGFFAPAGIEYDLVLLAAAVCLAFAGPGRYAVDHLLPVLRAHRLFHGVAAVAFGAVAAGLVLLIARN